MAEPEATGNPAAKRFTVQQSGTITRVVHDPAWAWRCETCGWVGTGLGSESSATQEALDHSRDDHGGPDLLVARGYPRDRPRWLGTGQPWPCGRCGSEHDQEDPHLCIGPRPAVSA